MIKKTLLLILCFTAFNIASKAQTQSKTEIAVEEARSLYQVIATGERGLLIGYIPLAVLNGSTQYKCIKLGTDLKEQTNVSFAIPNQYMLISNYTEKQFVYLLFSDNAYKIKRYLVVRVNTDDLKLTHFNGYFKKPLYFKELLATNGIVYLGGTLKNKPYVGAIDMLNDATSITDFVMNDTKKGSKALNAITISDVNRSCYLLLEAKNNKARNTLLKQVSNYKFCTEKDLDFPDEIAPDNAKIYVADSSNVQLAGTYGTFRFKEKAPGDAALRTGIFYGAVSSQNQSFVNYFPYNGFVNFKMNSNGQSRNLMVNFHNFIMRNNEVILAGEVFYPVYEDNDLFTGYRYTGALLMALDRGGNLKWENGLEIYDGMLSNNTADKFRFIEQPDGGIKIVYSDNNIIRSKIVYNGNTTKDLVDVKPAIENINDTIASQHIVINGVQHWYGNNYLVYAAQKINKSASEKDKENKTIFYFNRISLNDQEPFSPNQNSR